MVSKFRIAVHLKSMINQWFTNAATGPRFMDKKEPDPQLQVQTAATYLPSSPIRSREVPVRSPVSTRTLSGRNLVHEHLQERSSFKVGFLTLDSHHDMSGLKKYYNGRYLPNQSYLNFRYVAYFIKYLQYKKVSINYVV